MGGGEGRSGGPGAGRYRRGVALGADQNLEQGTTYGIDTDTYAAAEVTNEIEVVNSDATSLREAVDKLEAEFPGIKERIVDDGGRSAGS